MKRQVLHTCDVILLVWLQENLKLVSLGSERVNTVNRQFEWVGNYEIGWSLFDHI